MYNVRMKSSWNLQLLYESDIDPNIKKDIQHSEKLVSAFCKKWRENDKYLENPTVLREALDEYEELHSKNAFCDKPIYYFSLKNALDQSDSKVKGMLNNLHEISVNLSNEIQFFELNISKIDKDLQRKFINSKELSKYKHHLEQLFLSSRYLLTDKEERIFNLTGKTSFSNWVNMLEELLSKQEADVLQEDDSSKKVPYNEIFKYLDSKKKHVRDYSAKKLNKINQQYSEIAEFEINSILEAKKVTDDYRKVPRPDLTRHISDDIDSAVVDTMVDVVTKNFSLSQQYYKKKAKLLNQKKLGYHEKNVPLGNIDFNYSYADGNRLITKTFGNIDKDFGKIVERFLKQGQYDAFPRANKSSGAFCTSPGKFLPTYILLNYNGKLNDVLTIAHESGHAIHSEMSKIQNSLNCGYPTSLAEVASTFFEDFVLKEILNDSDEETKFAILAQKLNSDISSIFRQVAFYNFEKDLHESFRKEGYLNKEEISKLFCKHMEAYLGDAVEKDEGMKNGWVYWSHLRMFFYVYSYASGLLISKGLQSMVREDASRIEMVKEFLSAGSTKSPKELFKGMGIDITKKDIWKKGMESIKSDLELFESGLFTF